MSEIERFAQGRPLRHSVSAQARELAETGLGRSAGGAIQAWLTSRRALTRAVNAELVRLQMRDAPERM